MEINQASNPIDVCIPVVLGRNFRFQYFSVDLNCVPESVRICNCEIRILNKSAALACCGIDVTIDYAVQLVVCENDELRIIALPPQKITYSLSSSDFFTPKGEMIPVAEFLSADGTCIIVQDFCYIYRSGTRVEVYGYFYLTTKITRNLDVRVEGTITGLFGLSEANPADKTTPPTPREVEQQENCKKIKVNFADMCENISGNTK